MEIKPTQTSVPQSTTQKPLQSNAAGSSSDSTARQDSVTVTSQAEDLKVMEKKLSDMSGVDTARVEAAKAKLAEGGFSIDAGAIADALIEQEKFLL
jgi:negative regulator of flagellin synthesis FlgM